jgi:hypothetical protein
MKKCTRCGLLNDDVATSCTTCGFTVFAENPTRAQHQRGHADASHANVTAKRRGNMVILKCRTPDEAYLVRENLQSGDVIATLPTEEEMLLQYQQKGYVEVEVPAAAYDSAGDLRSIVEFSAPPSEPRLPLHGKLLAIFLAILIVPGLLIFAWLLTSYRAHGEQKKAKEFKLWFLIGLVTRLLVIVGSAILGG